jgi:polyhydroxyalkanoate synthesis regulator phasin
VSSAAIDLGLEKTVEKIRSSFNTAFQDKYFELEEQIELAIERAGRYFGIPTTDDLERVKKRLRKLKRRIDRLNEKLSKESRS